MTKCDFCIQSSPNNGCRFTLQGTREYHCKEAIKQMVKAFGNEKTLSARLNVLMRGNTT